MRSPAELRYYRGMSTLSLTTNSDSASLRDIYSVSRLNREARSLLEGSFPLLWLEGEISNLTRHGSGHWYFSLKDEAAQVRCAMFRNRNMYLKFTPSNGMQVLVRARISLYEARGEFQLVAEHMEEAGDGALRRAFEILKQRLQVEGLFNVEHKKALPRWPRCIGVITSPTGAAIRDILTTLQRRMPLLPVIVYPVAVQGTASAEQIAQMIYLADKRHECDVIILGRGGGSLEDLWAFNEEIVARAVYGCSIPIVTGIGHEVDFSIADFVADQRAATPTAAAELISPHQDDITRNLQQLFTRMVKTQTTHLQQQQRQLLWLTKRLPHPQRRLQTLMQRVDELQTRQQHALRLHLRHKATQFKHLQQRLLAINPKQQLQQQTQRMSQVQQSLQRVMQHLLGQHQQKLANLGHALNAVSPLATLQRGYAIVTRSTDGVLVQKTSQLSIADKVAIRLASGQLHCTVDAVTNPASTVTQSSK